MDNDETTDEGTDLDCDEGECFESPEQCLLQIAHDLENPDEYENMGIFLATCKNAAEALREIASTVEWTVDEEDGEDAAALPEHWLH